MFSGSPDAGDAALIKVVAVVLARDPSSLGEGLDALGGQVYAPVATVVVGGGDEAADVAAARPVGWASRFADLLDEVPDDVTYLWIIDQATRPRPDALGSLVAESERLDASVAGSKVLAVEDPELLLSVGLATDVFDVPYSGLDPGERDQAQYDVIRTVAAVSTVSMLVRRDLLRGLHGPDQELAVEAAGIDFCQRARLRGARVIVVPSSEVLYPAELAGGNRPSWREEAGRLRAMLTSYSVVTLAWALPFALATGLVEALVSPVLGRWTLGSLVRAWLWNAIKLPSTLVARLRARRNRVVGDEELFRYQVSGSARLRALGTEIGERIQERFPQTQVLGVGGLIEAGGAALRRPGFVSGAIAAAVGLVATRSIWTGRLPAVGFSLPPSPSAGDSLAAYAGGWNPAGLGTPWPLRPIVGAVALVQRVLADRPELTASVLTVVAVVAGTFGLARLLRAWGLSAPAAFTGGVAYAVGPVALAIGQTTHWPAILAMGSLPWVLRLSLRPWPSRWLARVGRLAALAVLTGTSAAAVPLLLVVPTAALVLWAVLGVGARWWAPVRAAVAALGAVPLLFPWFGVVSARDYLAEGTAAFWEPAWWLVGVVALGGVAVAVAGGRALATIGAWGAVLAAGGLAIARSGEWDFGVDVQLTGMLLAAVGVGLIVGTGIETWSRIDVAASLRRGMAAVAALSALVVVAMSVVTIVPGRAGLPGNDVRELLDFTELLEGSPASRALLIGAPDDMPGEWRLYAGNAYRVTSTPTPRLWEAHLGPVRQGDEALEGLLDSLARGELARAGEALAQFGIRWVVVTAETPLQVAFEGQLDLLPLPGLAGNVFVSEAEAPRALASDGTRWEYDPPGYRGPALAGGTVYLAENADQRWEPHPWQQVGWANEVAADTGEVGFSGRDDMRREATLAGIWLVVLVALALAGPFRWRR